MDKFLDLIQKCLAFEAKPQKIGLTQFKEPQKEKKAQPSIKNKEVKLSDLMRRAG